MAMNELSCRIVAKVLVDYSDGELPEADHRHVEIHLAACSGCRSELRLLDDSLSLAKEIWRESAEEIVILRRKNATWAARERSCDANHRKRRRLAAAILVAASVAALVLALNGRWLSHQDRGPLVAQPGADQPSAPIAKQTADSAPVKPSSDDIDIQTYIDRQARAARLAAAISFLAAEPSLKEYKDEAERYLARAYPEVERGKSF